MHHVVEWNRFGAAPARFNLSSVGIGVHDLENLVVLPTKIHQNVHNSQYTQAVNAAITAAVPTGYTGMAATLNFIKSTLITRGSFP